MSQPEVVTPAAAREALTAGRHEEALALAEQGLSNAPHDLRFRGVAAQACHKLARPLERIEHLRAITASRPDDLRIWRQIVVAVGRDVGPDQAVEEMLAAYTNHPVPGLKHLLSTSYRQAGRYEEALALWPEEADPESALARADILLESRRYGDAEAGYASVLAVDPGNVEALRGYARVAQRSQDWAAALERWSAVAAATPGDPAPLMHAAGIQRIAGDAEQAERIIQHAMELLETAQPHRFWGDSGEPHEAALKRTLDERVEAALEDQRRYLAEPGSPMHPGAASRFDAPLARAVQRRESAVLQYPSEVKFLATFLAERKIKSFFEVGLRHGAFAKLLDTMLDLDRVGGSEFIVTPKLARLMEDERYQIFAGDHHSTEYRQWREARDPFEFVFIDGGHSYNDVTRDYLRERALGPRYIGFHDVWNTACLGAKRMWDELPGKLVYYCNLDPSEYMLIAYRDRNFQTNFLDLQRESNGYCTGIGVIEVDA